MKETMEITLEVSSIRFTKPKHKNGALMISTLSIPFSPKCLSIRILSPSLMTHTTVTLLPSSFNGRETDKQF